MSTADPITTPAQRLAQAQAKADVLTEALPWIKTFAGATVVIKYGGNAMVSPELQQAFADDIAFLRFAGIRPIVVHGGGPQISTMLDRLGISSEFRAGQRVTSEEAAHVARMVLAGDVNRDIVARINQNGSAAVGLSGEDGDLLLARPATVVVGDERVDLGRVGTVASVSTDLIHELLDACGGVKKSTFKILMGGPMMGIALTSDEIPVLKQNNAILAFGEKEAKLYEPTACIRCGRCVAACPMDLMPTKLEKAASKKDVEALQSLNVMTCMECGCCAFSCPAGRRLVQAIRLGKTYVKAQGGKK